MATGKPAVPQLAGASAGDAPFRFWVVDGAVDPDLAAAACAETPAPEWDGWVRYDNDLERGKRTCRDLDRLGPVTAALFRTLLSPEYTTDLAQLSGVAGLIPDLTMHGAGLHVMDQDGWLQVHGDYERHPHLPQRERRLNAIAFLNPEWRPEWGGALLLCDPLGRAVQRIYPAPGRVAVFDCGNASFHGVQQVAAGAPPRVTLAAYYLAPARPSAHRMRAMFISNRKAPNCPEEVSC